MMDAAIAIKRCLNTLSKLPASSTMTVMGDSWEIHWISRQTAKGREGTILIKDKHGLHVHPLKKPPQVYSFVGDAVKFTCDLSRSSFFCYEVPKKEVRYVGYTEAGSLLDLPPEEIEALVIGQEQNIYWSRDSNE